MRLLTSLPWRLRAALGLALLAGQGCHGAPAGPPLVDATTVFPSPTLRQGQENVSIVFTRSAGGLDGATGFDLGGLVVTRQAQSTDKQLMLAVSVPHGVALGSHTLTFSDSGGPVSVGDVVNVDPITASPAGVDTALGTSVAPFRSVASAVAAAGPGDTIQLEDGVYDATAGETWGYTVPANLTIFGQTMTGTTLVAPTVAAGSTPGPSGFVAPGGLSVKTLTLSSFDTAISATGAGTLTLIDVAVGGALTNAVSANAAGVTATITGGSLGSAQDAILLGDQCTSCVLDVMGTALSGSSMGGHTVEVSAMAMGAQVMLQQVNVQGDISVTAPGATLSVSGATIKEIGSESRGTVNFSGGALDVTNSTITLNADNFGVNFAGDTLTLTGDTIVGGKYGVYQLAGNVTVRGTKIQDYGFMGYYLAQGDLDLGTATAAGNNAFSTSTMGDLVFGLYVDGITRPVTSSDTTFNGVEPPAGTVAAAPDQMIDVPGEYFINFGKSIIFSTL
jgi:hypothetical protein